MPVSSNHVADSWSWRSCCAIAFTKVISSKFIFCILSLWALIWNEKGQYIDSCILKKYHLIYASDAATLTNLLGKKGYVVVVVVYASDAAKYSLFSFWKIFYWSFQYCQNSGVLLCLFGSPSFPKCRSFSDPKSTFSNFDQVFKKNILTSKTPNKCTIKTFRGGSKKTDLMLQMLVHFSINLVESLT